ncbi:MAG: proline iminopeptidase [Haloplasmataceae bacterium]|jgi:pimeloyl-ACP methyl ester carboxylesterase|nr:proline iminopeptidase [Haloplasmataceae bacterium]
MKLLKNVIKIIRNVLLIVLLIIVVGLSTLLIYRKVYSNNILKSQAITSSEGINQEEIVTIGGIEQYLYIRGLDTFNPIILILHGGPGSPMTPLSYTYQTALEDEYTVVNWDQRNAGKTYFLNDPEEVYDTLSFTRMVEDIKEVTLYLLDKFEQEKIIILGHSWGSALGTAFVQTYPEYVEAYIGTGQVINSDEGDQFAFTNALSAARKANNVKDIELMENLTGYLLSDSNFTLESFITSRKMVTKYLSPDIKDTTTRDLFFSPYYSLKELSYFLKNTFEIQKPLMDDLTFDYDTRTYGTDYDVPIFYILGDKDWVTPTVTAKAFFETINAPKKELVIINQAGHMTMMDQTEAYCEAVLNVLSTL